MEKKLPIVLQDKVTTYLNFTLPLCTLKVNDYEWFTEHFSNIYSMRGSDNYLWLDYHEDLYFPKDILEYKFTELNEALNVKNWNEYIIDEINAKKYCIIFVDSYYFKGNENYNKIHVPIQVFIYGYSLENKELYSVGFDESHQFKTLTYNINEISNGINALLSNYENYPIWVKKYFIITIKNSEDIIDYRFNADVAIEKISDYIHSVSGNQLLRPEIVIERGNDAKYGFKAQEEVLASLELMKYGNVTIDYRYIHLIAEHKKLMKEKLFAIANRKNMIDKIERELNEYSNISKEFGMVRLKYLKNVLVENNMGSIFGTIMNKKAVCDIYKRFADAHEKEGIILLKILDYFK